MPTPELFPTPRKTYAKRNASDASIITAESHASSRDKNDTRTTEEAPPNRRGKKVIDHQTNDKIGFPSRLATGQGRHGKRRRIPQKRRHTKSHEIKASPPQGVTPPHGQTFGRLSSGAEGAGRPKHQTAGNIHRRGKLPFIRCAAVPRDIPSQKTHNNNNNKNGG